jgi:hypothetical protein
MGIIKNADITPPELFRAQIENAWKAFKISEDNEYLSVRDYISSVLVAYFLNWGKQEVPWGLSVELYPYLKIKNGESNLKIKDIGDSALIVASIIEAKKESTWKRMKKEMFEDTARTAYWTLYDRIREKAGKSIVFGTLCKDLNQIVFVLAHAIETSIIKESKHKLDKILRRYSRECTEEDRKWLLKHGVFIPDKDTLQ